MNQITLYRPDNKKAERLKKALGEKIKSDIKNTNLKTIITSGDQEPSVSLNPGASLSGYSNIVTCLDLKY